MEPYGWAVEWTLQQPGIMPDEDGDGQKGKPALKADRNQEVIDVQDTLGFWGVEPGATGLEEQGPTTRTGEECFRSTMLDLGEGLPCLGYSGMRSLEK